MSTILDREHLSLSCKCATRLKKVVGELIARKQIDSQDELYCIPENDAAKADLSAMTISELYRLYRRWPIRHRKREAEGREHHTYYYEGRIVRELFQRKAANKDEQLKIDYCVLTYNNELENLSFKLSLPLEIDKDKVYPDSSSYYTPEELSVKIGLYRDYQDVIEREILIEYVDMALDLIGINDFFALVTELAEIGRKGIIHIPSWVNSKAE